MYTVMEFNFNLCELRLREQHEVEDSFYLVGSEEEFSALLHGFVSFILNQIVHSSPATDEFVLGK